MVGLISGLTSAAGKVESPVLTMINELMRKLRYKKEKYKKRERRRAFSLYISSGESVTAASVTLPHYLEKRNDVYQRSLPYVVRLQR